MISIKHHNDFFIPLNSFIIDDYGYFSLKKNYFIENEILSLKKFVYENFNKNNMIFFNNNIFESFLSLIKMRLSLGERVILCDFDLLNTFQKEEIFNFIKNNNLNCFSIIKKQDKNFKYLDFFKNNTKIINYNDNIFLYKKIKLNDEYIEKNFNGITVVGDVHGEKEKLLNVTDWAKSTKNFLIFLGDIINHGPNSIECVEIIYELLIRNKCLLILGNHERKIFRILNKNTSFIPSHGNIQETIRKIYNMDEKSKNIWLRKFNTLINHGKLFFNFKNCIFTHAGFCEEILDMTKNDDIYLNNKIKNICMFGEEELNYKKNYNKENFNDVLNKKWIDKIPNHINLFVGHYQIFDGYPYVKINKNNAKIYFIDTGCGKRGKLSSIDLKFVKENKELEVKNFNIW